MPSVYYILTDRMNALELTGNDGPGGKYPLNPPPEQLIELTAVVLQDNGTPAPAGVTVYWSISHDVNEDIFVFYSTDKKQSAFDRFQTTTGDKGRSTVYLGAVKPRIATAFASTSRQPKPVIRAVSGSGSPQPVSKDAVAMQTVAVVTFRIDGGDPRLILGAPTGLPVTKGVVDLTPVDGSQARPPPQSGTTSNAPGPNLIPQAGSWILWTASGDLPQVGTVIGAQGYTGVPLVMAVPYSLFRPARNHLAYFVYGSGVAQASSIWTFDLAGTPLARPDDLPMNYPPWPEISWVSNPAIPATIVPNPSLLTWSDFDKAGNLYFAIPDYDGRTKDDVIEVNFYLNGWSNTHNMTLNTRISSPDPYNGSDYIDNYDGQNNSYLPTFINKNDASGFGTYSGYPDRYGYMWIEYLVTGGGTNAYNRTASSPFFTRINFPGP